MALHSRGIQWMLTRRSWNPQVTVHKILETKGE